MEFKIFGMAIGNKVLAAISGILIIWILFRVASWSRSLSYGSSQEKHNIKSLGRIGKMMYNSLRNKIKSQKRNEKSSSKADPKDKLGRDTAAEQRDLLKGGERSLETELHEAGEAATIAAVGKSIIEGESQQIRAETEIMEFVNRIRELERRIEYFSRIPPNNPWALDAAERIESIKEDIAEAIYFVADETTKEFESSRKIFGAVEKLLECAKKIDGFCRRTLNDFAKKSIEASSIGEEEIDEINKRFEAMKKEVEKEDGEAIMAAKKEYAKIRLTASDSEKKPLIIREMEAQKELKRLQAIQEEKLKGVEEKLKEAIGSIRFIQSKVNQIELPMLNDLRKKVNELTKGIESVISQISDILKQEDSFTKSHNNLARVAIKWMDQIKKRGTSLTQTLESIKVEVKKNVLVRDAGGYIDSNGKAALPGVRIIEEDQSFVLSGSEILDEVAAIKQDLISTGEKLVSIIDQLKGFPHQLATIQQETELTNKALNQIIERNQATLQKILAADLSKKLDSAIVQEINTGREETIDLDSQREQKISETITGFASAELEKAQASVQNDILLMKQSLQLLSTAKSDLQRIIHQLIQNQTNTIRAAA